MGGQHKRSPLYFSTGLCIEINKTHSKRLHILTIEVDQVLS